MKNLLCLLLILASFQVHSQGKSYDYCYTNKKGICVYSVADKMESFVLKDGADPCISPDGMEVAYTQNYKDGSRKVAIIDLNTRVKTILNTNSSNCYGPVWSPDGATIAYNVFDTANASWSVAVISSANYNTPKVYKGPLINCYMPWWTADGQYISVQNLDSIFIFDRSGNIVTTYKVTDLNKKWSATSNDRYIFTADKKVVFTSEANDPEQGADDPPTAVFVYDLNSRALTRLSPKGNYAYDVRMKGNKVLFTMSKFKSPLQNIYSVDMNGTNLKLLFANCANISAKN